MSESDASSLDTDLNKKYYAQGTTAARGVVNFNGKYVPIYRVYNSIQPFMAAKGWHVADKDIAVLLPKSHLLRPALACMQL